MINPLDFMSRVSKAEDAGEIVELPDGLIDLVVGGGPGDFHDVFNDSHVEGGIGPSFQDNFTDRYPFGDGS